MTTLYKDLSFGEYQKLDGVNFSTLKWGNHSMRHLRAAIRGELTTAGTARMNLGSLYHAGDAERV